jgi:undecaprenyl pyrophosphate synthase
MSNLVTLALILFGTALLYGFRGRLLSALQRFEARNARRRAEELRALMDRYAHYRQTVEFAEEQVEPVTTVAVPDSRTGEAVTRYLFLGEQFATRKDAEAARHAVVIEKAREFYIDLDRIYLSRRRRPEPTITAPALSDPSKHETYTPPRM